jgi:hypothetical protein
MVITCMTLFTQCIGKKKAIITPVGTIIQPKGHLPGMRRNKSQSLVKLRMKVNNEMEK